MYNHSYILAGVDRNSYQSMTENEFKTCKKHDENMVCDGYVQLSKNQVSICEWNLLTIRDHDVCQLQATDAQSTRIQLFETNKLIFVIKPSELITIICDGKTYNSELNDEGIFFLCKITTHRVIILEKKMLDN